jgi:hypothetical protein
VAILYFSTAAAADAVPDPKHIWVNSGQWVVFTDADIPPAGASGKAIVEAEIANGSPTGSFFVNGLRVIIDAASEFVQQGIGAVAYSILKRLQRRIDVYDFMTVEQQADFDSGAPALDHRDAFLRAFTAATTYKKNIKATSGGYNIDGDLSFPSAVSFRGDGPFTVLNFRTGGTAKWLPPNGAGNRAGNVENFKIVGTPASVGMQVSVAVFRKFSSILIFGCKRALIVDGAQNCIFDDLHLYNCEDGLVLVNGAGNNHFRRIESETMTRYPIHLQAPDDTLPGYAYNLYGRAPQNNTVERAITEYSNSATYNIFIESGKNNVFRDLDLGTTTHTTVYVAAGADLNKFYNARWNGGGGNHAALINYGYGTLLEDALVENFEPSTEVFQTYNRLIVRNEHFGGASYRIRSMSGSAGNNIVKNDSVFLDGAAVTSNNKSRLPGTTLFDNRHRIWHAGVDEALQLVTGATDRATATTTAGTSHSATLQLQSAGAYTLTARIADADASNARDALWLVSWSGAAAAVQKIGADNVMGSAVTAISASADAAGLVTISGTTGSAIACTITAKAVGAST